MSELTGTKYNVFAIGSPLQMLNAIEAGCYFKTKNNILLLLHVCEEESISQIEKLISFMEWDKIVYIRIPKSFRESFFFPIRLSKLLADVPLGMEVDKVFVGDFQNYMVTHLVNSLQCKSVCLIDDGTEQLNYWKKGKYSLKLQIKKVLFKYFLGYNLKKIRYIFFSIFDIKNETVIKNNYTFFKRYVESKSEENKVYFIGQPLVELKIMSEENFKKELSKIIEFYHNKKLVYILHRREDRLKVERLAQELNFNFKRLNNLIEFEVIKASTIPSDFATFFSTAIITLPYFIKDSNFRVFKIRESYFNNGFSDSIKTAYEAFEAIDVTVEEL